MTVLDLFSGIGGFSLGLERAGMETIAFCEKDAFCQKVLRRHWPHVPLFDDIYTLNPDDLPQRPDVITGGYPCQPFSVAGKQRGEEDDRHLWPQMLRIIQGCRPAWVIAENVAGHIRLGLDKVLSDLEGEGYFAQPFVIPACAINAPHRRDRVWIVGYAEHDGSPAAEKCGVSAKDGNRTPKGPAETVEPARAGGRAVHEALANADGIGLQVQGAKQPTTGFTGEGEDVPHTKSQRVQGHGAGGQQKSSAHVRQKLSVCASEGSWATQWQAEPGVGRVADGVPSRVDRIKALGNAVVPQIPELIGRAIVAVSREQYSL